MVGGLQNQISLRKQSSCPKKKLGGGGGWCGVPRSVCVTLCEKCNFLADNERKLKAINIISLIKIAKCSLDEMKNLQDFEIIPREVQLLSEKLQGIVRNALEIEPCAMDGSDANVVNYVAGALVRSELNMRKCASCTEILRDAGTLAPIPLRGLNSDGEEVEVCQDIRQFTLKINRGGLVAPSTLALGIGLKCWDVFNCINLSKDMQSDFLSSANQQLLFVLTVEGLLEEDSDFEEITVPSLKCSGGHPCGRSLVKRFFNCFAKNWVKRLSGDGSGGQSMKIAKLGSLW